MRRKFLAAFALLAMLLSSMSAFASWKPIGEGKEKIAIDPARIARVGDGFVAVWSRLELPQAVVDAEGRYNAIEALNRYDCTLRRFTTLKRLYLQDEALVRAESVLVPKEMSVPAAGLEASIMVDVCKAAPESAAATTVLPAGVHEVEGRIMTVAAAASDAAAPATQSLHRFIILPRIDPSMVEHPTDEPPPDSAKTTDAKTKTDKTATKKPPPEVARAVKSEAEKAGVKLDALKMLDKRAREIALATSGPSRIPARNDAPAKEVRWGYAGDGAPSHWGQLSKAYRTCDRGQRQSPIDVRDGIRVDLEPIAFDYQPGNFSIVDTGNTIQITPKPGGTMSIMGRTYQLVHIRFHHPGEQRVDGRGFDMSMELEHRDQQGNIAIVAVMIERGEEQPVIQAFWNNLPLETDSELTSTAPIDLAQLLPTGREYYAYMGSLTTPPCSEGVLWLVMKQPLQVSPEQIAIFARLYPNNARPLQAANGRLIKESR